MDKINKKPDFKTMNSQELKSYILSHRDDDEAFYAYVDKINERKRLNYYKKLSICIRKLPEKLLL